MHAQVSAALRTSLGSLAFAAGLFLLTPAPAHAVHVQYFRITQNSVQVTQIPYGTSARLTWYCPGADSTRLWTQAQYTGNYNTPGVASGSGEYGAHNTPVLYADATYYLGCQDNQLTGYAHAWGVKTIIVTPLPPAAPALPGYSCNAAGTQATISWPAVSGATFYQPRSASFSSSSQCPSGWSITGTTCYHNNWTSTSFTQTITPGAWYSAWVHAGNSGGVSAASPGLGFLCAPPPPPAPAITQSLCTSSTSCSGAWNAASGADRHILRLSPVPAGGCSALGANWYLNGSECANDSNTATSFTFNNLTAGTQYAWRVYGVNTTSAGGWVVGSPSAATVQPIPAPTITDETCETSTSCGVAWNSLSSSGANLYPARITPAPAGGCGALGANWYLSGGGCVNDANAATSIIFTNLTPGTPYIWWVHGVNTTSVGGWTWSPSSGRSFTLAVPFDFSLSAPDKTVTQGINDSIPIGSTLLSGSAVPISSFSISPALPAGVTASFSPSSCTPTNAACTSIALTVSQWATPGTAAYALYAAGGGVTRSDAFTLTVQSAAFDFSLSASAAQVTPGSSVPVTVGATHLAGTTAAVGSFTISGLPSGVTASFSPSSCTPSASTCTTATLTASGSATPGTYPVTVYASGGGASRSATFNLTVNAPPPTVTIVTSDSEAGEPGTGQGVGVFTISRAGSTASSLPVSYAMSGSAAYGSDYTFGAGTCTSVSTSGATMPSGSASCTVVIQAVNDATIEPTKSLVSTLQASAAYSIGSPSSASMFIRDDDTPPSGIITSALSATPRRARQGGTVTLSWSTLNMISCSINQGVGAVSAADGAHSVPTGAVNQQTTFTLTCIDGNSVSYNSSAAVGIVPAFIEQ